MRPAPKLNREDQELALEMLLIRKKVENNSNLPKKLKSDCNHLLKLYKKIVGINLNFIESDR